MVYEIYHILNESFPVELSMDLTYFYRAFSSGMVYEIRQIFKWLLSNGMVYEI